MRFRGEVRELNFHQPVDGTQSHKIACNHVGSKCRQRRGEVEGLDAPTFPGQQGTEKEKTEKFLFS